MTRKVALRLMELGTQQPLASFALGMCICNKSQRDDSGIKALVLHADDPGLHP